MVDYQTVSIMFTGLSISLAAFYYINTLRNAQRNQKQQLETRQAQLLMNIMNTFRSREFRSQWHIVFDIEAETFDDFRTIMQNDSEIRTAWTSVLVFFESVGVLVRNQMIDVSLIHSLMGLSVINLWERSEHLILGDRAEINQWSTSLLNLDAWDDYEYLYNEIRKYDNI